MKRKLLREFAAYLERGHTPFNLSDGRKCISFQACRFNGEVKGGKIIHNGHVNIYSSADDLLRIFDLSWEQADAIYVGWDWGDIGKITRKVAAKCVRYLAGTGKVDWDRALNR